MFATKNLLGFHGNCSVKLTLLRQIYIYYQLTKYLLIRQIAENYTIANNIKININPKYVRLKVYTDCL